MSFLRRAGFVLVIVWLSSFAHTVWAQNPVTWSVKAGAPRAGGAIKAGDKFTVQLTAVIAPGWHLYSITQGAGGPIPTRITLPDGQLFKLAGAIKAPAPRVEMDKNFGINTETYEGSANFTLPVAVASDASAGEQQLLVNVRFQACNDTMCLPPKTIKLNTAVALAAIAEKVTPTASPSPQQQTKATSSPKLTPTPAANTDNTASANNTFSNNLASPVASPTLAQNSSGAIANETSQTTLGTPESVTSSPASTEIFSNGINRNASLWSFIWLAMTFGAVSLLTPCVFPMVPITVSYFTNHAAGNRSRAVRDALIYALGIILTFTALGVTLALLFGAAGINKFAANPYINLLITAIFIGFALSLFGAYNLQVPSSVLTKLDAISRNKQSGHVAGLLLMGLTFSLTSFTCTAPFVGTLLVMAAQGDWVWPMMGMLAFSTVFALPFFILALAPQLVSQLPRSGGWLNSVKVIMGLLEIAAAM